LEPECSLASSAHDARSINKSLFVGAENSCLGKAILVNPHKHARLGDRKSFKLFRCNTDYLFLPKEDCLSCTIRVGPVQIDENQRRINFLISNRKNSLTALILAHNQLHTVIKDWSNLCSFENLINASENQESISFIICSCPIGATSI
jgi:hypothetical protein